MKISRRKLICAAIGVATSTWLMPIADARIIHGTSGVPHTDNFLNFTGSNLSAFQTALAGSSDFDILCIGDSTTAGKNATNKTFAYPDLLAAAITNGNKNSFVSTNFVASLTSYDPRISLGTGWFESATATLGGFALQCDSPNTGKFAFLPTSTWDTARVTYIQTSGAGTATLDIGGGTLATTNCNGSNAVVTATISVSLGTHTLNIARSTGGSIYVLEVRCWNSAVRNIFVLNAGFTGHLVSDSIATTNPWDAGSRITALAPKLCIAMDGINDWNLAHSTDPAQITAYGAAIATRIGLVTAAGGSYIQMVGCPSNPAGGFVPYTTQQLYITETQSQAYTANVPFINIWAAFGSDWSVANGRGWMSDDIHENNTGYGIVKDRVVTAIAPGFRSLP